MISRMSLTGAGKLRSGGLVLGSFSALLWFHGMFSALTTVPCRKTLNPLALISPVSLPGHSLCADRLSEALAFFTYTALWKCIDLLRMGGGAAASGLQLAGLVEGA